MFSGNPLLFDYFLALGANPNIDYDEISTFNADIFFGKKDSVGLYECLQRIYRPGEKNPLSSKYLPRYDIDFALFSVSFPSLNHDASKLIKKSNFASSYQGNLVFFQTFLSLISERVSSEEFKDIVDQLVETTPNGSQYPILKVNLINKFYSL
jgi:hypothetical protein